MIALPEKEVHIWNFNVHEFSKTIESYENLLSPKEIAKVNKFKFAKDRRVSILTRGLLRILSGRYLNQLPESINFNYGAYGKPDYNFETQLKFNISHSENIIVMAFVRNCDIGVDIEKIKSDFDVMDIAQHFFSSDEIQSLQALPEKDKVNGFYRCWTRKESFIKAKGSGLSFPLTSFTVSLNVEYAKILITEWDPREKDEWKLFSFRPFKGYIGALSVRSDVKTIKYWDFDQFNALSLAF